ncbi:MAG: hydroxysqualene dehydroxylase HpnE [Proteobacteria bacterium]|nr:hydroxysqualene dehydroxylase HpnE [Pseudomonadota bacterium]MDA1356727.1 hydroxysqualene dehydroxylase HpnE [Pseudomonadota bacterium]
MIHVVGAGMAGLACAVEVARSGRAVTLHESAGQAGGRCRSFHDETLDRVIDNGNHLILGANPAVFSYLDTVDGRSGLVGQTRAEFPFVDIASGERWVLRPNAGLFPWWIFSPARRVPGTKWTDYLAGLKLARAAEMATIADCVGASGPLVTRLWEPLTVAVLNASTAEGAARLLWPVLRLTFGRGEAACRAYVARRGLGPDLVEPGVKFVGEHGGEVRFGARLRGLNKAGKRIEALDFGAESTPLGSGDSVVLAMPPANLVQILPEIPAPLATRAIVNAHFRLDHDVQLPGGNRLLGIIGGTAHWLFARGDIASVTVSAADKLAEKDAGQIAELLWRDVAFALGKPPSAPPPVRIVKEKRATFAQIPAAMEKRAVPRTAYENLFLAGDWTATGLPATIEGAVLSGQRAAALALAVSRN